MCAAQALGLKSVNFLEYRDSGMAGSADNQNQAALVQAPLEQVAGRVVKLIRSLRPQVVVTFDPVGGYHHPDHIHIHNATVAAFQAAGDAKQYPEAGAAWQPSKLYYTALNRRRLRWLVRFMRLTGKDPTKVGRNKDIDLTELARDADTPPHVTINYRSVEDRKNAADACHASQQGGRFSRFSLWDLYYRLVGRSDTFTRMQPPTAAGWRARDLFAD
jgi:N-acetyl-1-D-myo-inositol-2-amino-2-deoxy-alpha-D-glucopyranoside deacetylase/mycothiol S-conjugate amidase